MAGFGQARRGVRELATGKGLWLLLGALFVAAEIVIAVDPVGSRRSHLTMAAVFLVQAAVMAVLCWATGRLTGPADGLVPRGRAFALQLSICFGVIIAASLRGDFLHVTSVGATSWWEAVHGDLFRLLAGTMPDGIALGVVNFTDYVVPVAIILGLTGISAVGMGLGAFRRGASASAVVWLVLPLAGVVFLVTRSGLAAVGYSLLSNLLQNGVSEEFLFRGALLGRLRAVMPLSWALATQAIVFGLWHVRPSALLVPHSLVLGLANALANHAVMGLAMGYVAVRTGNIAIPTIFHMMLDTVA